MIKENFDYFTILFFPLCLFCVFDSTTLYIVNFSFTFCGFYIKNKREDKYLGKCDCKTTEMGRHSQVYIYVVLETTFKSFFKLITFQVDVDLTLVGHW